MSEIKAGSEILKGVAFWRGELEKTADFKKLSFFNDVLTSKRSPEGYGKPVLVDVILDGKKCDVYHTDMDGQEKLPNQSGNRVLIHFKE